MDSYTPDDLALLLRSARPEAQDYVANLGEDKHTRCTKHCILTLTNVKPAL